MSKIALAPNASGTGTLTISAPDTSTDRTIDLPDAAGTVFVSGQALSATTGSFSGDVTLGSSVLATPSGSAPSYTCRAWVNFNGSGTVAIRASGNVSSITDINTGRFQINFTTAMQDANFAIAGTTRTSSANFNGYVSWEGTASVADTTFVKIATTNTAGAYIDGDYISVIVSR